MISDNLKTLIDEHIKLLPEYHQEVLGSFNWATILEEIGAKYRLSEKQIELFVRESAMLILHITDPELYKVNIMNHVGVSEVTAHNAIMDVNNRIITRLQTELTRVVKDAPDLMLAELTRQGVSEETSAQFVTATQQESTSTDAITVVKPQSNNTNTSVDPYREEIE